MFLLPVLAFAQKPDFVRSPNGPNTIVDWNVKFKTMIVPHGNTLTLAGAQDSTGHIRMLINPGVDTSLYMYMRGVGWLPVSKVSNTSVFLRKSDSTGTTRGYMTHTAFKDSTQNWNIYFTDQFVGNGTLINPVALADTVLINKLMRVGDTTNFSQVAPGSVNVRGPTYISGFSATSYVMRNRLTNDTVFKFKEAGDTIINFSGSFPIVFNQYLRSKLTPVLNTDVVRLQDIGTIGVPNGIISGLIPTPINDSTIAISAGYWRINNIIYHKASGTIFHLATRDSVQSRYDVAYATNTNTISLAQGTPSLDPVEPPNPANTIRVASAFVTPTGTFITPVNFGINLANSDLTQTDTRRYYTMPSDTLTFTAFNPNTGFGTDVVISPENYVIQVANSSTGQNTGLTLIPGSINILGNNNSGDADASVRLNVISDSYTSISMQYQNTVGFKGVFLDPHTGVSIYDYIDNVGVRLYDTLSYAQGLTDSLSLPPLYIVKRLIAASNAVTVYTGNGSTNADRFISTGPFQFNIVSDSTDSVHNYETAYSQGAFGGSITTTNTDNGNIAALQTGIGTVGAGHDPTIGLVVDRGGGNNQRIDFNNENNTGILVSDPLDQYGLHYPTGTTYEDVGELDSNWIAPIGYIKRLISGSGDFLPKTFPSNQTIQAAGKSFAMLFPHGFGNIKFRIDSLNGLRFDWDDYLDNDFGGHFAVDSAKIEMRYRNLSSNSAVITMNAAGVTIEDAIAQTGWINASDYSTNIKLNNFALTPWGMVKNGLDSLHTALNSIYVPQSRTITINGTSLDLSANRSYSVGTVTSIATSTGITGGTITGTGTLKADTSVLQTVLNFFPKADTRYLKTSTASSTYVPLSRILTAGVGINSIGDLSADRTISTDTSVLRTVANSYTLAALQTKFNLYPLKTTTVAGFALSGNISLAALTATDATLTFSGSYDASAARTVGINLATANTWTGAPIFNASALGTTPNSQVTIGTSTAAANGAQQVSGGLTLQGNGWGTTAGTSQATQFRFYSSPAQGTVPSAGLNLDYSVAGGSFNQRFIFGSGGNLTLLFGSLAAASSDGLLIRNATAATSGVAVQNVGRINMLGHVWNTTATAADNQFNWIAEARGVSGTTPTSAYYLASSLTTNSTTSFTDRFKIDNSGNVTLPTGSITLTNGSDATGDIYYRAVTTGLLTRLGIGSTGQELKVVSGLPSWQAGLQYLHNISTPTTGGTVNLTNNQYNIINPAGALLALTVNLPSTPANNDVVYIKYTQAITTVTYGNGTVVDAITAPAAGGLVLLIYDSGTTSWY